MLAVQRFRRTRPVAIGLAVTALLLACYLASPHARAHLTGWGWSTVGYWAVILCPPPLSLLAFDGPYLAAGAAWLMTRDGVVRTDQLVHVTMYYQDPYASTYHRSPCVTFRDAAGSSVVVPVQRLRRNPAIWNLVREAVGRAATVPWVWVDALTRRSLDLPR